MNMLISLVHGVNYPNNHEVTSREHCTREHNYGLIQVFYRLHKLHLCASHGDTLKSLDVLDGLFT